jgi:hypothetical protein
MPSVGSWGMLKSETQEVTVSQDVMLRVEVYSGGDDTVVMLAGAGLGIAALGNIPQQVASAGYRAVAVNPRAAGSTAPSWNRAELLSRPRFHDGALDPLERYRSWSYQPLTKSARLPIERSCRLETSIIRPPRPRSVFGRSE